MSSKGNLLKHLQVAHHDALKSHKEDRRMSLTSGQSTLTGENPRKSQPRFHNQDTVVTSLALNMCGHGGLPIQMCEQPWFRHFIHDIEPRFTPVSRVTVKRMLGELYANKRDVLLSNIVSISLCKPSVTADFWSGCDSRSFMGCTIHYMDNGCIKDNALFFKEVPPPHTAINIRNRFEDELDCCGITAFVVVSDNAANMKSSFTMELDQVLNPDTQSDESDDSNDTDENEEDGPFIVKSDYWTEKFTLNFESWIGCAAHSLQLVVHAGYKELLNYR